MTPSFLLGMVLAWGLPLPAMQPDGRAYVGALERTAGKSVWARIALVRGEEGEWAPALALDQIRGRQELDLAPNAMPPKVEWRTCRDGRSLGTIRSKHRRFQLYSELGTHALLSRPDFLSAAHHDKRFTSMMVDAPAIRPFVVSTLSDACRIGLSVRRAGAAVVARLAEAALAEMSRDSRKEYRVEKARGWQAGGWIVVEVEYEQNGGHGTMVLFAIGDQIRRTVHPARVVDWISADGDDTPDVMLWTTWYNRDGYTLVYDRFEKQAEFEWLYH